MLFNQHGKSAVLKNIFAQGENDFSFTKLHQELKKISDAAPKPVLPKEFIVSAEFKKYSQPKLQRIDREQLPDRLKGLDIKKGELWAEAGFLNSKKNALPYDAKHNDERKELMARIEYLFDVIDAIWKELDYFQENKKELPPDQWVKLTEEKLQTPAEPENKFKDLSPVELIKKRASISASRSRWKLKPEKNAEQIKQADKEIAEIDKLING
jgi:hypothetical protein